MTCVCVPESLRVHLAGGLHCPCGYRGPGPALGAEWRFVFCQAIWFLAQLRIPPFTQSAVERQEAAGLRLITRSWAVLAV